MPQPDGKIIELFTDLQACLCSELTPEGDDEPPLCLCVPLPGFYPAQTYAGVGTEVAWVRLADYFPSNSPGVQAQVPFNAAHGRTLLIEVGVLRCYDVPDDGEFDSELLMSMWLRQMADLGAIERAIACCTGRSWDSNQFVVGNYRPIGPEGDLFGGAMAIAMQIE